uniref:Reverse transcriptase domain-containing protein n=1 Tax=Sparus aurata TaxID=8175 RepID=A0A671WYV8_SPAAU
MEVNAPGWKRVFFFFSSPQSEYALFRTKQAYWEMGERPGRLLAYRLKQQDSTNHIAGTRQPDGRISTSSKQINKSFRSFYKTLYSSQGNFDEQKFDSFFADLNLPRLTDRDRDFLEAPIKLEEISQAIRSMPPNKSPGLDGLPADFYRTFKGIISPILLESMHTAVISFIRKKGKDDLDPSGYRPISLLNCDQNILAKILSICLSKVIGSIIHMDQSGFIPNRHSSDNIRRLVNLLCLVYDSTHPTITLSLDALFETLGRFGCPLSLGLFVLALEPLAQKLRNNSDMHGITVDGIHHKLLLYTDDMLVMLTQPEKSIPTLLNCIEEFAFLSGYHINWDKSEAMPLSGHCPSTLVHRWKFRWASKGIKYLGIRITPDYKDMVRENINPLLQKMKSDFGRWTKIHLSLWGKIHSVKMMSAPVIY